MPEFNSNQVHNQFASFQDYFLTIFDRVLLIQAQQKAECPDQVENMFNQVLAEIQNLSFLKTNPNGNVQFVIAQLGPILQRISD